MSLYKQIVAGCPSECKTLILRPFLASILTLKTVIQSAPEHTIFIQKIEKFSHPSLGASTGSSRPLTPLYKILDTPLAVNTTLLVWFSAVIGSYNSCWTNLHQHVILLAITHGGLLSFNTFVHCLAVHLLYSMHLSERFL